ncbi:secreted trypsin-like serine protease [Actinokineospora baliensis]|uniref:trypsin-like serine protease n=1 Tax=Actinokineospora baliensis TaxID=547056 RepID=UPI00195E4FC3|nr:trypsin-like serine protease [Actinokineospora baliensis]MBM7776239.1 secreted trypsin-like serine protease [Actinokineospora baliensis]
MKIRTLLRAALIPAVLTAAAVAMPSALAAPPPAEQPTMSPAIVGGSQATETYSFMGSMQVNGRHGCGASLVASQWMVTAAHCVTGQGGQVMPASQFQIRIGSTNTGSGGTLASVSQVVRHPSYSGQVGPGDIALFKLSSAVSQAPITINDSSPAAQTSTRLIGFGQTCPQQGCGGASPTLKQLDTRINPDNMCSQSFNASTELCVYGTSSATACYGDSGGPAVVKSGTTWRLVGATSRAGGSGSTCGGGSATIYTDVTAYRSWINQYVGGTGPGPGPDPEPPGCSAAAWNPYTQYPPGSTVTYQGYEWRNSYWSYREVPGGSYNWQRTATCTRR